MDKSEYWWILECDNLQSQHLFNSSIQPQDTTHEYTDDLSQAHLILLLSYIYDISYMPISHTKIS